MRYIVHFPWHMYVIVPSHLLCAVGGPSFLWTTGPYSGHVLCYRGDSGQCFHNCRALLCGSSFGDHCSVPCVVYQITGIEKVCNKYSVMVKAQ